MNATRVSDQGSWEAITTALDRAVGPGRSSGAWTQYCCPVHEADGRGHRPSLGVKYDDRQQRTVVRCFAGCDNEQVLESIGLQVRDMFDRRLSRTGTHKARPPRPRTRPASRAERALEAAGMPSVQAKKQDMGAQRSRWGQVATYPYLREDGSVAGEVLRWEADFERGRDKKFSQRAWSAAKGSWVDSGFDKIPYQLPQVLEQIRDGGVVYVVEGEKDVAAAESAGLVATTNAGGATSWSPDHARWLEGAATVVIVADNDPAGYRRADRVRDTLTGLVGRVRVVRAATGKDLHDHLQCGHEIGELEPIPYLDPYTRPPATQRPALAAETGPETATPESPAAEADPVSAAVSHPEGDPDMGKYMLAPDLDTPPPHSDEVDRVGGDFAKWMNLFLTHLIQLAARKAAQRIEDAIILGQREEAERRAEEQRIATERKAVETRLAAIEKRGWNHASREELADAVLQARAWAPESDVAKEAWYRLRSHLMGEYGIYIGDDDKLEFNGTPYEISEGIRARQAERVQDVRAQRAHDRMVETVAAQEGLDESTKQALYAEIREWSRTPGATTLDQLGKKLAEAKVPEKARDQIRFIGVYLSVQSPVTDPDRSTSAPSLTTTHLLRKLDAPLVDPGEEIKPRIDQLLISYQDQLRAGKVTSLTQMKLANAVRLLTPEEQKAVRERGEAIRREPTKTFVAMFPDHVDRDELASAVQLYAALQPQADQLAVTAGDYNAADAAGLRQRVDKARKKIQTAISSGKGLHELERDQLEMILRDVSAGQKPPAMVFADDRSAAAADASRADGIARGDGRQLRKETLEMLTGIGVDPDTARSVRINVEQVVESQVHLAAGRMSLHDYGEIGSQEQLAAAMTGAGIPEGVRNRVIKHVDKKASEAAITGKQSARIAERWAERTEAVVTARSAPAPAPAYDSPHRRLEQEIRLKGLGLNDDQIAQHMAASSGRAQPPSAAVRNAPGHNGTRINPGGAGVQRTHHRNRGDNGIGR
ncbi:toprim domain-containing protein [Nocardia flavorosea]|uniref:toprim domain-containing protein n=1 Tax=Nocardia flavorosea TaxID=53429 RepID=UPI00245485D0|nr:toprim domain-containing protein [Nocardia flavorosea]